MSDRIGDLKTALQRGPVMVTFTKRDGDTRMMLCTTNIALVPSPKRPKGTGRPKPPGIVPAYDLNRNDWRSFDLSRVQSWTPSGAINAPAEAV